MRKRLSALVLLLPLVTVACDQAYDDDLDFRANEVLPMSCDWAPADEEAPFIPTCTVECVFGDLGDEPSCSAEAFLAGDDWPATPVELVFDPTAACFDETSDEETLLYPPGATQTIITSTFNVGGTQVECLMGDWVRAVGSEGDGESDEP